MHEGELVDKGQVLLRIDNVVAASDLKEGRARWLALSGLTARLDAEAKGNGTISFPKEVLQEAPEIAKREQTRKPTSCAARKTSGARSSSSCKGASRSCGARSSSPSRNWT